MLVSYHLDDFPLWSLFNIIKTNFNNPKAILLYNKYKKGKKTIHLQVSLKRNNLLYIKEKEKDIINSKKFRIL